jgi:hypothetical protein
VELIELLGLDELVELVEVLEVLELVAAGLLVCARQRLLPTKRAVTMISLWRVFMKSSLLVRSVLDKLIRNGPSQARVA